jgi:hypothetical protein
MFDRQHRANRMVVSVETVAWLSGMEVILASSGPCKDTRVDISLSKARLVAHEAQRSAAEDWIEYGQRQT